MPIKVLISNKIGMKSYVYFKSTEQLQLCAIVNIDKAESLVLIKYMVIKSLKLFFNSSPYCFWYDDVPWIVYQWYPCDGDG